MTNRKKSMVKQPLLAAAILMLLLVDQSAAQTGEGQAMVDVTVGKRTVSGRIVARDSETTVLQRRDGSLNFIPNHVIDEVRATGKGFRRYSGDEIRQKLASEFGSAYTISRTPHFFVVHPPGDSSSWSSPFEELYQRFNLYFTSRGFTLTEPEFPMVAVVLGTRQEFDRFLARHQSIDPRVLGYYAPNSNRIITYANGEGTPGSNLLTNSTIVHEATHQTAYNLGLHSRFAISPRWISEGLAVMFEAPGVNNSSWYGQIDHRVHKSQLATLMAMRQREQQGLSIGQLVSRDDSFRTDPDYAYALAWGLTFFLAETRSAEYVQYLGTTASIGNFSEYSDRQRLADFALHFGNDLQELESRMWKYLEKLPR